MNTLRGSLFLFALAALLACAGTDDCGESGSCCADSFDEKAYPEGATLANANICVVADLNEQRAFEVKVGAVTGRLTVDGSASVLSFPSLTSVGTAVFLNCSFARADFPQLASILELKLFCKRPTGFGTFVLGAETLQTIPALEVTGPVTLDMPALSTIDELTFFDATEVDQLFVPTNTEPLAVGYLRIDSSTLNELRINRVSDVDTLDILGSGGDLLSDGFPDLRHVRMLHLAGVFSVKECSLNQLIDQLDQPPESVVVENALLPCN